MFNRCARPTGGTRLLAVVFALAALICLPDLGRASCPPPATSSSAPSIGPWEPLGLSGGGGMFAPAISPVDPDLMMVNCDMSGAYLSHDGGLHWRLIDGLQLRSSTSCRPGFHPTDRNTIYAASGWEGRLRVTRDGGEHWADIGDLPGGMSGEIALDPDNPSLMLTGGWEGVWLSRDAGNHWTQCKGLTGEALSFAFDRSSPQGNRVVIAATKERLWRSDDAGRTWTAKTAGLPTTEIRSFAGASDPGTGTMMLYCAVPSESVGGVYRGGVYLSRDRGESWEPAMGAGINTDVTAADEWAEGQVAQYWHVLTTDVAPLTVWTFNSSTGFWPPHNATAYRSDDGGETWRATFFPDPRGDSCNVTPDWYTATKGRSEPSVPFSAAVCPTDPDRVIFTTSFCHTTADGGKTWRRAHTLIAPGQEPIPGAEWLCNGLVVTTTWHYFIDPHQPNRHYICYTDIGFARSLDAGKTWIWWEEGKSAPWTNTCYGLAFDPDVPGKMWGAFSDVHDIPNDNIISGRHSSKGPGGICVSTDFGESWTPVMEGLPEAPATSIILDPTSPKDSRTVYATVFDHGVYRSTDGGASWTKTSDGLGAPENTRVYRVLRHSDGTLFALITAKREGRTYLPQGVGLYRSRDSAKTWQCITTSVGLLWPKDFAVDPRSSDTIFVGAADAGNEQGGLYRTTDGGRTWQRVAREGPEHFGAYFHPQRPGWVYMTLCEGAPGASLWLSTDSGETWKPFETFPFSNAQRVEFDPADPDVIYVTTFGASILRGPASPDRR
jgi:photosystem II stability/assembly factor-like uncharacterized protein